MPFSISPDPNMLWLGENHSEALAALKYGIYENKGFLVLTGDVGTGKTALINRLLKEIDFKTLIATIPDPGLTSIDLFKLLSHEFKLKGTFKTKVDFLLLFKKFLHQTYASYGKVLLIIDEAQRTDHNLLEQIRLLSNIELDNRKLINIFFVGQSEFNEILMMDQNRATRQRIAVRYHLKPLTEEETTKYVQFRLKIAGASREIFKSEAIQEVFHFCRGYPRLINILCDRCLITGYSEGLSSIYPTIVAECARDLDLIAGKKDQANKEQPITIKEEKKEPKKEPKKVKRRRFSKVRVALIALLSLVLVIAGYSYYKSKFSNAMLFDYIYRSVEKIDYTLRGQEEPFEDKNFSNNDENNYWRGTSDEYIQPSNDLIYFNHDSNELDNQSLQVLDNLSKVIFKHPDAYFIIQGYTDSQGNFWYNKQLSRTRAEIVKSYLVEKGILPSNIEVVGMGSENPIASNETAAGRRKNRRVEIQVILE